MSAGFDYRQVLSPVFVETGCYRGDGIDQALSAGFETVHSIEISAVWINHCRQRFAKEIAEGRLVLWQGDTLAVLPEVITHLSQPATFWLDAHSHPHNIGVEKSAVNCPLYHELAAIAQSPIRSHTILIDDLRLITDPRSWGGHDVTFAGVLERLRGMNANYAFVFLDGLIEKDVLVARVDKGLLTDQATLDAFHSDPLSQSIQSARSALSSEPARFMRYRFLVTRLLHRANPASVDFAEAFAVAREATERWPKHAPAWDLLAQAAMTLARQVLKEGHHAAETASQLKPDDRRINQR